MAVAATRRLHDRIKLGDGESYRVAIVSKEPRILQFGEKARRNKKPFRFENEPTAEDISDTLGDFVQRLNFEGTAVESQSSACRFLRRLRRCKIKVFEVGQKTLIGALDKFSQQITKTFTLGISSSAAREQKWLLNIQFCHHPAKQAWMKKSKKPGRSTAGYDLTGDGRSPFGSN